MTRFRLTLHGALLAVVIAGGASGCQLIADFDRSKIPTDAGQPPDGSFDDDAGAEIDGGLDAMLPLDAGHDAAQDAAQDAETVDDSGADDDAGTGDDAG